MSLGRSDNSIMKKLSIIIVSVISLRMYIWWSLCTLYLHICEARVTVGDSGLCFCTGATY